MRRRSPGRSTPGTLRARVRYALPELAAVALGVALRIRLRFAFAPEGGYDWISHLEYAKYVAARHAIPPPGLNTAAYHPPLFYVLCAGWLAHGAPPERLQWIAIAAGIARLGLIAWGLRTLLPEDRFARAAALAVAAVLPANLFLDGMVTNESLSCLFGAGALLAVPAVVTRDAAPSPPHAAARLAAWLALGLLAKVSALVLMLGVALGALGDLLVRRPASFALAARRVAPAALAVACALAVAVPVYAVRNRGTGRVFATAFEAHAPTVRSDLALGSRPYLDRRSLGYVFGLGPYRRVGPQRFWPTLEASAFGDYSNYYTKGYLPAVRARRAWLDDWARVAYAAGGVLAVATLLAYAGCAIALARRRDTARLTLLAMPALAALGQLHFAISYPHDGLGMVKAHYMMFAAPPLFAAFGVGAAWLWRRRGVPRAAAVALLCALALVALSDLVALGLA